MVTDAAVQTVWVDRMTLMLRADAPLVQLSFQTVVDGRALQVVCRLQTTTSHAHSMVDVLCRNLNYYPSRPPGPPPPA